MTETAKKSGTENTSDSPLRENLVETAVNFLLYPSVRSKPEPSKTAFLKNKGLTDKEISAAFLRAHLKEEHSITHQSSSIDKNALLPLNPNYTNYSFWTRLSSVSSSLIVIAVALYGLHRFYKIYIEPWLFGTKSKEDDMKVLLTELSNSVTQLKDSISSLELTVNSQKENIDKIFLAEGTPYMPIPMAVADLKTEIGNVKSLLINRHQFPAVPKVASNPSIPLWQLSESGDKTAAKENHDSDAETKVKSLPTEVELTCVDSSHSSEAETSLDQEEVLHFDPNSVEEIEINASDSIEANLLICASITEVEN